MTTEDLILKKLEGLAAAFNRHDVDGVLSFFAEDCSMELPHGPDPFGRRFKGKAAVRSGVASRFAGLPDVHYADASHCVVGLLGISRWTVSGTMPSGERIAANGCDFYYFDAEGRVTRKDSYWKNVQKQTLESQQE